MKIVMTVHQFLPDFSAGTEILTYETAKELARRGHNIEIFTGYPASVPLSDDERFDDYVFEGIKVWRFKHAFEPMGTQSNIQELEYNNLLFKKFFKEYLAREKPDIVHFFHLARLSASAIEACRELSIPTVLIPTDFWFICPTSQLRLPDNRPCSGPDRFGVNCFRHIMVLSRMPETKRWLLQFPNWFLSVYLYLVKLGVNLGKFSRPWIQALVRRADFLRLQLNQIHKVVVPTRIMRKLLIQNGLDEHKIFDLPFGLNYAYGMAEKKGRNGALRLGYIGTLADYKGVHVLLKAMLLLQGEAIDLKIYGKLDDYPDYVESLMELSKNDSRIKFCNTFPNSKIGEIFANLDALAVPSLWHENSPLVVYSAQSAHCPVIASNMEGLSEIIEHEKNGLLFEAGNAEELALQIKRLLDDRDLLDQFSNNVKMPMTIHGYVDRLLTVYAELCPRAGQI